MLAAANSIPPNRTVSPIAEYGFILNLGNGPPSLTNHSRHPPAKSQSRTESAWSVLSSPWSTRYHSPERPASPERVPAAPIAPEPVHVASTHATGGTFASESSSGVATPVSARSLLFSLTEQLAAHRESRAGGARAPAPASASTSSAASPAVSARSVLLDASIPTEPVVEPRPTTYVRPSSRVAERSRSTTPRNARPARRGVLFP